MQTALIFANSLVYPSVISTTRTRIDSAAALGMRFRTCECFRQGKDAPYDGGTPSNTKQGALVQRCTHVRKSPGVRVLYTQVERFITVK